MHQTYLPYGYITTTGNARYHGNDDTDGKSLPKLFDL
jgi:hypothetical protein